MKFTLSFKTPDVLDQLDYDIQDEDQRYEADATANKFLQYGECINVEFDTKEQTAIVLKS